MIDLRSDTLTMPSTEMLSAILTAPLGDAGRLDSSKRGCDPTTNALEDKAAEITGKDRSLLLSSGTLGNHVALLTHCKPGDKVLIDTRQHLYRSEKAAFSERFGQLVPVFYHLTSEGYPDADEIASLIKSEKPALLCIENSHNNAGGTAIPLPVMECLYKLAHEEGIRIHLDGARLFNAAEALGADAKTICGYADSVMFCISKGLGAPIGSLLCGDQPFIIEAAETRKLLGGNMRQSGIIAAAGLYALEHNIPKLAEDHRRATEMLKQLRALRCIGVPENIQSNMILMDVAPLGLSADSFIKELKEKGVWVSNAGPSVVRIVLYNGISDEDVRNAVNIIINFESNCIARSQ